MKIIALGILGVVGILSYAVYNQTRIYQKEIDTCNKFGYSNVIGLDVTGYVTCANYSVTQGYFKLK